MFIDAKSAVVIQSCQVLEFQGSSRKRVVIDTNWSPGYTILSQLNHYLTDVCEERVDDGLAFWARKLPRYNKLSDLGEDLMAAPASQAYVERIFLLCSQLTVGSRGLHGPTSCSPARPGPARPGPARPVLHAQIKSPARPVQDLARPGPRPVTSSQLHSL